MVLWTPILSLINFLNDLNIQKSFELVNANDAAFTYANYKDVIQKITANSNFLSYLIMLTPMLAFALAKGSEMGFVSIASSLSQQLAGGARAAGGFATQQALSTSTAITTPKGDEVYAMEAGVFSHKGSYYDSNGNLTSYSTRTNGYSGVYNSQIDNSIMSGTNVGGLMQGAKLSDAAVDNVNAFAQTQADNWNRKFSDGWNSMSDKGRSAILNIAKGALETDNNEFRESVLKNINHSIDNMVGVSAEMKAGIKTYAGGSLGVVGGEIYMNAEAGAKLGLTESQRDEYNQAVGKSLAKSIASSYSVDANWSNSLNHKDAETFSELREHGTAYTEAQNSVQSIKGNDLNNIINGLAQNMAANNGENWNALSVAQQNRYFADAGSHINNLAQNNPAALQGLQKQFGAGGTTQGETFTTSAEKMKFAKGIDGSEMGILQQHNLNMDKVNTAGNNMLNKYSAETMGKTPTDLTNGVMNKYKDLNNKLNFYMDTVGI